MSINNAKDNQELRIDNFKIKEGKRIKISWSWGSKRDI